ncbi:MAG: DUF2029 domain-containing protein, partial [Herpetosiphonaceae bacterium]|nr:DUF2029 domain-containing protein [Herpetosiphonaceae bacterium]
EIAPYTHRLLLIVVLAHLGLGIWAALLRSGSRWWHLPAQIEPVGFLVLLGLAYWLMLPYHAMLGAEMGSVVGPRPGTEVIGSTVWILLLPLAVLPMLSQRVRRQLTIGVLVLSGVAEAIYAAAFAFRRSGPDFFILWRAAYDFHLGRPLYKMSDVLANHYGHVFKVPPFYGMLFLPFATSNDIVVLAFHRGLNVILYLITAVLLVQLLRLRLPWSVAVGIVGVVMGLMQPPFDTIAYGQIDIALLLLLTIALLALRSQRPWLSGVTIALGTLFKLYPALLLGFLFVRREWKAFAWTLVWLVLFNAVAIGVMGWQSHVTYVTQVLPNIGGGTSWVENQTINGFLSRLLTGTMRTDPIHDRTLDLLTYGIFTLVAGTSLLLAMIKLERRSSSFAVQMSIFTVVMVMVIPAAWMHYQTITILAFVALAWHAADHSFTPGKAVLIAIAFALIAYGNQWSFFTGTRNPGLPALALSYKCYGLVILWGIMSYTIWQAAAISRRARQAIPAPRRTPNNADLALRLGA